MMPKYENAALQNKIEFARFCELLKDNDVRSYLEIGSKHGGSLWMAAHAMPPGSLVVSVDLPHGDTSFKESQPHLEACVRHLSEEGYKALLFLGDSTDQRIIDSVKALGPFDAVFIDANHTLPYVTKDWENYGQMATKLVAFHDVGWKPRPEVSKKMPIEVPMLWNKLKQQYRHQEICLEPRDNGIGVLWRSS
jgi:predicted O-methyltransferase YrrM